MYYFEDINKKDVKREIRVRKIILPAQGRARVVGVLVAGTALLELPVRALRRSISNSPSLFHNSSLSFSLFFSLQLWPRFLFDLIIITKFN